MMGNDKMLKVLSLFSGIGAFEKALERLNIDYELVGFSEIDKYAIKSYCAIHGVNESLNLGDVSKIDTFTLPKDIDLLTHGSPCQDFSLAGKQAGGDKDSGTRSSLMYETIRIIGGTKPKYIIWENVKNLLSKKHIHNFNNYLKALDELGYNSYYEVLNAKDYGIPQNRERVFTVSIRKDIDPYDLFQPFPFPEKQELKLRLKDLLEENVDEKYYLSEKSLAHYMRDFGSKGKLQDTQMYCDTLQAAMGTGGGNVPIINEPIRIGGLFDDEKGKHQAGSIWDINALSPTLDTMQGGYRQPCVMAREATKKGYAEATVGDSINLEQPNSKTRRGRVGKGVAQTLTTSCNQAVVEQFRIRKLTPRECWRLMGFSDEDFDKVKGVSNTQLYKQAGNSIVVNVLVEIFRELLESVEE